MKHILYLALLTVFHLSAFAQYENIDLSKYKLPDIKRHQLDFDLGLNNSRVSDDWENSSKKKHSTSLEELNVNYTFFQNTRKLQKNYLISINSNLGSSKKKGYGRSDVKQNNARLNLLLDLNNYYYLNEKNLFIRVASNVDLEYTNRTDKIVHFKIEDYLDDVYQTPTVAIIQVKDRNQDIRFTPRVTLGFGKGRIEPVGDVRHAIYIAEELTKNNRLNRDLTEDEIFTLAKKISELKNKRFFDSRLRKIYEIKSIDSLLNQMNVTGKSDATYFTSLTDMWDFGGQHRTAGTRLSFDVSTELNSRFDKDYTKNYFFYEEEFNKIVDTRKGKFGTLGFAANYNSHKPIGLKLQRKFAVNAMYSHLKHYKTFSENENTISNILSLAASYQINYFLNTRTYASATGSMSYAKYGMEVPDSNREHLDAKLMGSLYYYFSPRLRLSFNTQLTQHWSWFEDFDENTGLIFRNTLGINYSLF